MKRLPLAIAAGVGIVTALGCQPSPESAIGFRLPDGNVEIGSTTFTAHGCHSCHNVEGEELPDIEAGLAMKVTLGGETVRMRTYGELVSSVINPSHRLATGYPKDYIADAEGRSKMTNYNEVLTVQELIDLVAFLQSKYRFVPPHYEYRPYAM